MTRVTGELPGESHYTLKRNVRRERSDEVTREGDQWFAPADQSAPVVGFWNEALSVRYSDASNIAFGSVEIPAYTDLVINIKNEGKSACEISTVETTAEGLFGFATYSGFSIQVQPTDLQLDPGESTPLTVRFTPISSVEGGGHGMNLNVVMDVFGAVFSSAIRLSGTGISGGS